MVMRLQYDDSAYDGLSNISDIKRIILIAINHRILLTPSEAARAWAEHSDSYAAGWLILPDDDCSVWYDLPNWARGERND